MKCVACTLLSLAIAACATAAPAPPPAPLLPPPVTRSPGEAIYNRVAANADAARIIQGLENRGLKPIPDDVSAVEQLASAPGYVWRLGPEYLHIHADRDPPAASAAAQAFVTHVVSRSQIIDWVGTPRLFQCRTALALYLGNDPRALNVLTYLCGPPAWTGQAP